MERSQSVAGWGEIGVADPGVWSVAGWGEIGVVDLGVRSIAGWGEFGVADPTVWCLEPPSPIGL